MQVLRSLYGTERLELEDLIDTEINHLVELAYYKIKDTNENTKQYAIEIVKTEHLEDKLKVERKKINLFTDNETKTDYILKLLKKNKVTPIGLRDTLTEILKTEAM